MLRLRRSENGVSAEILSMVRHMKLPFSIDLVKRKLVRVVFYAHPLHLVLVKSLLFLEIIPLQAHSVTLNMIWLSLQNDWFLEISMAT
jgi:hypothetical protein